MEICEEVIVHRSGTSEPSMVASDKFPQEDLVQNSIENRPNRFSIFSGDKENNNIPHAIEVKHTTEYDSESGCCGQNDKVFDSRDAREESTSLKVASREISPLQTDRTNKHDTYSIASSFSSSSSSSSLSSMGIMYESERRLSNPIEQRPIKVFGPADEEQSSGNKSQAHQRISRVPSKANPKYRVPSLNKNQRSKSQPYISVNHNNLSQRRNSSPSNLTTPGNLPRTTKHFSSTPNYSYVPNTPIQQPREIQQQQQQVICLQIPHPSQNQLCDPQGLQQQISAQLQLLVPQIYNQLLNQMNVNASQLNAVKMSIDHNTGNKSRDSSPEIRGDQIIDNNSYLNSNFTVEGNQSQRVMNQVFTQNFTTKSHPNANPSAKGQKPPRTSNLSKSPTVENINENENTTHQVSIQDLTQILQLVPPQFLQQNFLKLIKQQAGYPSIQIPVTQELLLQVQQLQQTRDTFRPTLEPIMEESLSVHRLNTSRVSKTKVIACVITILCVVAVILLSGDKLIAVAVIAAIFILFLVASTFYLYTHSTKNDDSMSTTDGSRIQVSTLSKCDKQSFP